jgi:predicted nucleotidyltransferase
MDKINLDSKLIIEIKNQILSIFSNSEIILFGSRAKGENTLYSDFDLLIITDESMPIKQKYDYRTRIRKELLKFNILSDILIQSKAEVEVKKTLPGHVIKNAIMEGIYL